VDVRSRWLAGAKSVTESRMMVWRSEESKARIRAHDKKRNRRPNRVVARRLRDKKRHANYMNRWRLERGDDYRTKYRVWRLKQKYGLSLSDFENMLSSQNNCCAACGDAFEKTGPKRLVVDHDHVTNKVRGVLCCACNRTIGHAQDEVTRLRKCADYLERTK
jgi:hypothetical protein